MDENNQNQENSKILRFIINAASWIIGIFFVFAGFVELLGGHILAALFLMIGGLIILPIIKSIIRVKSRKNIRDLHFNILAGILIVIGISSSAKHQQDADAAITQSNLALETQPKPTDVSTVTAIPKIDESQTKPTILFDLKNLMLKDKSEVESIIGKAESCEKSKYGTKCFYKTRDLEIIFINGKADWITLNQVDDFSYTPETLELLGYKAAEPTFANDTIMRWEDMQGFRELSLTPMGNNKVFFIYLKTKAK